MSTTLEAELLGAAEFYDHTAVELESRGLVGAAAGAASCAARLRQRVAWVREQVAMLSQTCQCTDCNMTRKVTGPIPAAETAPTERTP